MNIISVSVEMWFISKNIIYEFKKSEYSLPDSFCINVNTVWFLREYLIFIVERIYCNKTIKGTVVF